MKKLLLLSIVVMGMATVFVSCGKDDPAPPPIDHGKVTIEPNSKILKFGETVELSPKFSNSTASSKECEWYNTDSKIVSLIKNPLGGKVLIKAERIGKATITIRSLDNTISGKSEIEVESRTNFLNNIFFELNANAAKVKQNVTGNKTVENADSIVYSIQSGNLEKIVFIMKNDQLKETLAIIKDTPAAIEEAQQYLQERFPTLPVQDNITFYDATVLNAYVNTKAGIFIESNPVAYKYKQGVIFRSK